MSIQEVNGKGPKKRKKSLEHICDNEERPGEVVPESVGEEKRGGGGEVSGGVQLLHWRDMPQHLQFNPYVLTGYRPLQSWAGCIRSLFYFHNETINILTHGNVPHWFITLLLRILTIVPWAVSGTSLLLFLIRDWLHKGWVTIFSRLCVFLTYFYIIRYIFLQLSSSLLIIIFMFRYNIMLRKYFEKMCPFKLWLHKVKISFNKVLSSNRQDGWMQ